MPLPRLNYGFLWKPGSSCCDLSISWRNSWTTSFSGWNHLHVANVCGHSLHFNIISNQSEAGFGCALLFLTNQILGFSCTLLNIVCSRLNATPWLELKKIAPKLNFQLNLSAHGPFSHAWAKGRKKNLTKLNMARLGCKTQQNSMFYSVYVLLNKNST